jgi:predicted secreted hydrolase
MLCRQVAHFFTVLSLALSMPYVCLAQQMLQLPQLPNGLDLSAPPQLPRPVASVQFPRDLFEHANTQMEWWYYTGNVKASDGSPYGFELTFFRTFMPTHTPGQMPGITRAIFAHLAVSDLKGKKFYCDKTVPVPEDEQHGLVPGASPWTIRFGDWKLTQAQTALGPQTLQADHGNFGIDLTLKPEGPPVLHGVDGFVQKGSIPGQGSDYYSIPRLAVTGTLRVDGSKIPVTGISWTDHEFMHMAPGESMPYWDWFAIQLTDGSSLMIYGLHSKDGSPSPTAMGTWEDPAGHVTQLKAGDISLTPGATWHSPASGANYPIEWQIGISSLDLSLKSSTPLPEQEMLDPKDSGNMTYWEGASRFNGKRGGKTVTGVGYIEMTGYTK